MQVIDTLLGLGPMRDIAIGDPISSASASLGVDNRRGPPQLVACSGQGRQGSLTVLRRTLVPELIVQVPLTGSLCQQWQPPPIKQWLLDLACRHQEQVCTREAITGALTDKSQ